MLGGVLGVLGGCGRVYFLFYLLITHHHHHSKKTLLSSTPTFTAHSTMRFFFLTGAAADAAANAAGTAAGTAAGIAGTSAPSDSRKARKRPINGRDRTRF